MLGPNYTYGALASEATGRKAVQLVGQGRYVSFTLTAPANAVDFHYAVPDSLDGTGLTAPLSIYVNGAKSQDIQLTSQDSWLYGAYTFTNNPTDVGNPQSAVPHDFYNDVRTMFPSVLPAGTVVTLQVDAGDSAPRYAINTADFENVAAPLPKPAGFLDVTQAPYGIDPTGVADATTKLQQAVSDAEAAGTGVYLPQGLYKITLASNDPAGPLTVALTGTGNPASGTDLALTATMTASGSTQGYTPGNTNDGNTSSYWESAAGAFPQWLRADLGSTQTVGSLVLDLPPATAWAARTETLSVQGSTDGSNWTTLKASAGYTFDPATGNTVTVALPSTSLRYLRLNVTANTGWPAAQLSELQIFS